MATTNDPTVILGVDFGQKRIGIAAGNTLARLAQPLITIEAENGLKTLVALIDRQKATAVVVGLPRGLNGQETPQTAAVRNFTKKLRKLVAIPVYFQDEALTSINAEKELANRGVRYNNQDVDALAAAYILEDYFRDHPE